MSVTNQHDLPSDFNCPACREHLVHTDDEWERFHPHAAEGFDRTGDPTLKDGSPNKDSVLGQ